jgi:hypothetical protein
MPDNDFQQYPQPNPRGVLVFRNLPGAIQDAEDATQAADHAHMRETGRTRFARQATNTEKYLLRSLGYELPEGQLLTRVDFITASLRRRIWPALGINA